MTEAVFLSVNSIINTESVCFCDLCDCEQNKNKYSIWGGGGGKK
jgi:hypothetical protein